MERTNRLSRRWLLLVVVMVLMILPACSPEVELPSVEEEESAAVTVEEPASVISGTDKGDSEEAAPLEPASGETVPFTVFNDLDIQICELYISASTEDVWGPDFLDGVLEPGESQTYDVTPELMDMMAVNCVGEQVAFDFQEDISGGYTWNLSRSYLSSPLPEGEGDSTVLVRNNSGFEICWIYISPTTSELWGNDWLGDETLAPDDEMLFYLNQNDYDIQIVDCNEDVLAVEMAFPIAGEGAAYTVDPIPGPSEDGDATLMVSNPLDTDICWLYIAPPTFDIWGPNRLGADILLSGETINFTIASGEWDVQAVDCQDNVIDARPLTIDPGAETVWELSAPVDPNVGGDSSLEVVNQSDVDICWLMISPTTASVWGDDWLGADILSPGASMTFSLDAGLWDAIAYDCDQNVVAEEYQISIPAGGGLWTINGN